jgi:small-conductance mechanosensitive channel
VIAFAVQGAVWIRELILGLIGRKVAEENGSGALGNAMAIIRVLVSVALFAIAGILILDNLGVNVTALVAGLGIGGIAIGLAAQGIFSDLFAALSILFDKPFKRGDTIRYDNSTGTVERIGLKTTRLRSITGEQLIMANTKLLEREIHNMAQAKSRRVTLYLAVGGEASAAAIDAVGAAAAEAVSGQKGCKLIRCALAGAGGGGLAFDLVYDDSTRDSDRLAADRAAILRSLIEALHPLKLTLTRASDQPPAPLPF